MSREAKSYCSAIGRVGLGLGERGEDGVDGCGALGVVVGGMEEQGDTDNN